MMPQKSNPYHAFKGRISGEVRHAIWKKLCLNEGHVTKVSEICECLYEGSSYDSARVAILKMRRVLEGTPWQIRNVHGVGYILERRS